MVRHYSWKRSTHGTERLFGRTRWAVGVLIAAIHDCLLFRTARGFAERRHKAELKKRLAALPADTPAKDRQKLERATAEPETLSDATMVIKDGGGSFSLYDSSSATA